MLHILGGERFLQDLSTSTNHYGLAIAGERYVPIEDPAELQAWLGIWIALPLARTKRLASAWKSDPTVRNLLASSTFSRDRYLAILRFLHPVPGEDSEVDKMYKLRPLITQLKQSFQGVYKPTCELSVDESMIGFQGRLSFRQYMPKKAKKFGIKVWCLAESRTGYILNFDVYTGKDKSSTRDQQPLASSVVINLLQPYQGLNHSVYMDNFFTSYQLMLDLASMKIYSTGTYRRGRRGFPTDLPTLGPSTQRGHFELRQQGNMVAGIWYDNRAVHLASNCCDWTVQNCTVSRRTTTAGSRHCDVPCPEMASRYNMYMGGVDLADRLKVSYSIGRRSVKYWKYVFFWLLETACVNAYLIWRHNLQHRGVFSKNVHTHEYFRKSVVSHFVGNTTYRRQPAPSTMLPLQSSLSHAPVKISCSSTKRGKLACFLCSRRKCRTRSGRSVTTTFQCNVCNVPLCLIKCFAEYHGSIR